MAKFNFKKVFEDIGKIFVQGLSKRMKQQKGIDGGAYSSPAPSTLLSRRGKKSGKTGKVLKSSGSTKRLVVTGELSNEGFGYSATDNGVKVFARPVSHSVGVSYDRLIEYNSKGQSKVNKNIKNPPLVFPTNKSEVEMMQNEIKIARELFAREAKKQIQEMAKTNLKVQLRVG